MTRSWNVLVVDDDADIHDVTDLALRRKTYRGRSFHLMHANSAAEARRLLEAPEGRSLHVSIVDVVMESDRAGLELCEHIRNHMPDSLRIILRTGQPGRAPEETVMNDYDIDTYLAKANLNADTLHTALRAACRSSVDIATATAHADQLREYIEAFRSSATGVPDLTKIMYRGLDFLEEKHDVQLAFVDFVDEAPRHGVDLARLRKAVKEASSTGAGPVLVGPTAGLHPDEMMIVIIAPQVATETKKTGSMLDRVARWILGPGTDATKNRNETVIGAIYAKPADGSLRAKERTDLTRDINRFIESWRVAMMMLAMREEIVAERMVAIEAAGSGM